VEELCVCKESPLKIWNGQEGEGRCQVNLTITDTGRGLQGLLTGGEQPHVGGVVLALPRPSLRGEGWSSDVYLMPVPGHKDVDVARIMAETLAQELLFPVTITAGIHSDQLNSEELSKILFNCDSLTKKALEVLNQLRK
jgi:gallate decarboxylase subunit D